MTSRFTLLTLCILYPGLAAAEPLAPAPTEPPDPLAQVEDTPGFPRVLLIGDSISIGYTPPVRELLAGKANIHRPTENCGPTSRGIAKLDDWLGEGRWDVIHFNFGLHDIRRMDQGVPQVPPDAYEKNLRAIVARLRQTEAKLIWASTTPVPFGLQNPPRISYDVPWYNAIAEKVMKENDVPINDLYSFVLPRMPELQRPQNVHFTDHGSRALAGEVAAAILREL